MASQLDRYNSLIQAVRLARVSAEAIYKVDETDETADNAIRVLTRLVEDLKQSIRHDVQEPAYGRMWDVDRRNAWCETCEDTVAITYAYVANGTVTQLCYTCLGKNVGYHRGYNPYKNVWETHTVGNCSCSQAK